MLNLNELESKLNNALENESSERLTNWINQKRLNIPQLEQQFDEILDSFNSEKLRDWLLFAEQREKEECEQVVNDVVEPE